MPVKLLLSTLVLAALPVLALASPYDGLSAEELRWLPEFQAFDEQSPLFGPSRARESAAPDAPYAHEWIGWIDYMDAQNETVTVVFDSHGYGVSLGSTESFDNAVPLWAAPALEYLYDWAFISDECVQQPADWDAVSAGLDTDVRLRNIE